MKLVPTLDNGVIWYRNPNLAGTVWNGREIFNTSYPFLYKAYMPFFVQVTPVWGSQKPTRSNWYRLGWTSWWKNGAVGTSWQRWSFKTTAWMQSKHMCALLGTLCVSWLSSSHFLILGLGDWITCFHYCWPHHLVNLLNLNGMLWSDNTG